jgi:putative ABC transport system substrate-binding protein
MARVAKAETSRIPIVFTWVDGDPADAGLVTSPGRPGGNLTGLSYHYDLFAQKRLELVRELLPRARRVVTLVDKAVWNEESVLLKLKVASSYIGLQLDEIDVSLGGMKRALEGLADRLPDAVVPIGLHSDPNYSTNLAEFQARTRVPVIDDSLESAEGVVIALAEDDRDHFRRAADMAVKVLNGANPRELPVDGATRFFLVVNERAATGIGINIPATILIRADRVIR